MSNLNIDKIVLNEDQINAIEKSISNTFTIITGGAGTGKTTIIKEIADRFSAFNVLICAFSGKAAARITEATGYPASTIHRMLIYTGDEFRKGTLAGKIIIIDEGSMIPSDLLYEIIKRNPAKLILVGDQAQLPPVGKGQPFHDIIKFFPESVCDLKICYRNSEAIHRASQLIRSGNIPPLNIRSEKEIYEVMTAKTPELAHSLILDMISNGSIDFNQDIILVPKNGDKDTPATVKGLNAAIKTIVNPQDEMFSSFKWQPGDRVINTENISSLNIWNGTTGTIDSIDIKNKSCILKLDNEIFDEEFGVYKKYITIPSDKIKYLHLAYALSVHKSQGSQYRKVIFVALMRDRFLLLNRQMVYTAVTRAKNHCIIIGDQGALIEAIHKLSSKNTVIQEIMTYEK